MYEVVKLSIDGEVGVITIDNPPVNALGGSVSWDVLEGLRTFENDIRVQAILLICEGRTFIVGADLRDFELATSGQGAGCYERGRQLFEVTRGLEHSTKPVVAAMHGTALGGGFEIALACQYRVALPSTLFGLPEVKVGLIPGGGGTQRLPRLVGVAKAAEMCATGESITTDEAKRLGLIDEIVEGELRSAALSFTRKIIGRDIASRRTGNLPIESAAGLVVEAKLGTLRKKLESRGKHLIAPWKAIEAVDASTRLSLTEGLQLEGKLFFECLRSEQSKALIHLFFAERVAVKIPGILMNTSETGIQRAAVVGAGTMGTDIAMCFADAGIPVLLKDVSQSVLERGMQVINGTYDVSVAKGSISAHERDNRLKRIEPTLLYDHFSEADIVVEAVVEELEVKKRVFSELERMTRADAILASNTSTFDIDEIATAIARPSQVVGYYFYCPLNEMRLVEITRGSHTSPAVIAASMKLARRLKKKGVLVGNSKGLIGYRMLGAYRREVQVMVDQGASMAVVNSALQEFGLAMESSTTSDIDPSMLSREQILERALYALVNEGARIIDEGAVSRAADLDVICVNGCGFPAYRGGPMWYADRLGLQVVFEKICEFRQQLGPRWEPALLLKELATANSKFADIDCRVERTAP